MFHQLALLAVPDFPLVEPGNELASMISDACLKAGIALNDGDVVVIAQKIVSKAEARYGQAAEGCPIVILRGLKRSANSLPAVALIRPASQDLFRRRRFMEWSATFHRQPRRRRPMRPHLPCDSSIRSSERSPNGMSFGLFNPWCEQRKI